MDCIRREKGYYSRDKVRLYLRYCLQFEEGEGIWVVKVRKIKRLCHNVTVINLEFFYILARCVEQVNYGFY